jgi:hypothetical protein
VTFMQAGALRRIENGARALRARYAYLWSRTDKTAPALRAGVAAPATADLDLLRCAYRVVGDQARMEVRSPLVADRPVVLLGVQERTVREDLVVPDVLRENHVLRLDDDDLDEDVVSPLEEALDAYYSNPEDLYVARTPAFVLLGGRRRLPCPPVVGGAAFCEQHVLAEAGLVEHLLVGVRGVTSHTGVRDATTDTSPVIALV